MTKVQDGRGEHGRDTTLDDERVTTRQRKTEALRMDNHCKERERDLDKIGSDEWGGMMRRKQSLQR